MLQQSKQLSLSSLDYFDGRSPPGTGTARLVPLVPSRRVIPWSRFGHFLARALALSVRSAGAAGLPGGSGCGQGSFSSPRIPRCSAKSPSGDPPGALLPAACDASGPRKHCWQRNLVWRSPGNTLRRNQSLPDPPGVVLPVKRRSGDPPETLWAVRFGLELPRSTLGRKTSVLESPRNTLGEGRRRRCLVGDGLPCRSPCRWR